MACHWQLNDLSNCLLPYGLLLSVSVKQRSFKASSVSCSAQKMVYDSTKMWSVCEAACAHGGFSVDYASALRVCYNVCSMLALFSFKVNIFGYFD